MRETLLLVADYREIPLKRLIKLGEEIFGLSPRTIRNHLSRMVTVSFELKLFRFRKELKLKVFPVGFYKRRNGEKVVYFIDQVPKRLAIAYITSVIIIFLTAISQILEGDLPGAMSTVFWPLLMPSIGSTFLSYLGHRIRHQEGVYDNEIKCVIKYREKKKNIIVKGIFKREARLSKVKEYAIQEIGRRRGEPLRGEYILLFIGEGGREIRVNEVNRLYLLDGRVLHFKLVKPRKLSKPAHQKTSS